jgi:CubicO group peptidase (beta-lactamase class C family)
MTDSNAALGRLVRAAQSDHRIPALSVALHRADRPTWSLQVGISGTARPLDAQTRFRMGSITKTFTAVAVMQCRDEGLLDLDDPVGKHLQTGGHGDWRIRRLLSHTSGIQREPYGDVWDTLEMPVVSEFLADLARAEQVLPPARRYHYSNVGVAVLGQLVAALRGGTWSEVVEERILSPLDLRGIQADPDERCAVGYLVDAYSDHARAEPRIETGGVAPAAQLWGTAADLARWGAFLADPSSVDPDGRVLAASTVAEMRWPVTVTDEELWGIGFGLGLMMFPRGLRAVHIGHDGAMPGFLAAAYGRRGPRAPKGFGAAVLGSSGTAAVTLDLVHTMLDTAAADDPAEIDVWTPGQAAPEVYRSVLGRWWSEGFEYVFSWREGLLTARGVADPPNRPPAVFEELSTDVLRTVSGREVGELLRLHRDPGSGEVVRMHWATYRVTRIQETFDGMPAGHP